MAALITSLTLTCSQLSLRSGCFPRHSLQCSQIMVTLTLNASSPLPTQCFISFSWNLLSLNQVSKGQKRKTNFSSWLFIHSTIDFKVFRVITWDAFRQLFRSPFEQQRVWFGCTAGCFSPPDLSASCPIHSFLHTSHMDFGFSNCCCCLASVFM